MNQQQPATGFSRRSMLMGTGTGALAGLLAGTGVGFGMSTRQEDAAPDGVLADETGQPVDATGTHQAGVTRPQTPQPHGLIVVGDLTVEAAASSLAALGTRIQELTAGEHPETLLDGPGDLSVLVGVGPRILHASAHAELHDLLTMPSFTGDDQLAEHRLGGDLLLSISSSNPVDLEPVAAALTSAVEGWSHRWSQQGFRGPGTGGVARNPLGYHDGVTIPRDEDELAANVWLDAGPLAHGTICVLRTFALDTHSFAQLSAEEQDAVMGRERATGAPLSGGSLHDDVSMTAKTDAGEFLIPNNAHIRAAHPSFTGSGLMLRRSYSYQAQGPDGPEYGLVFTAFQRSVGTFTKTQLRMDEMDALMDFATVRSTAAFAILPGYSATKALGASLF